MSEEQTENLAETLQRIRVERAELVDTVGALKLENQKLQREIQHMRSDRAKLVVQINGFLETQEFIAEKIRDLV